MFCFWYPLGILTDLWESFWVPWGTCWKHFWIVWHPVGNFLGLPGLPQWGRSPLGQTRLGLPCDSLGVLGDPLGTLCGDPGGQTDRQTDRHTDRTRMDQTRPDQRPDIPEARPETRQTDRPETRADQTSLIQSRAIPMCFPFRC